MPWLLHLVRQLLIVDINVACLVDDDLELFTVLDRLAESLRVDVIPGGLGACLHDQLDVQVVTVVADPTRELVFVVAHEYVLVDPQGIDPAEAELYLSDPYFDFVACFLHIAYHELRIGSEDDSLVLFATLTWHPGQHLAIVPVNVKAHVPILPFWPWLRLLVILVSMRQSEVRPVEDLADLEVVDQVLLVLVLQVNLEISGAFAPVSIHEVEGHLHPPDHQLGVLFLVLAGILVSVLVLEVHVLKEDVE